MYRQRLVYLVLTISLVISGVWADDPPWILLERGKAAYERRDLALALEYLLEAVEVEDEYPEAEFWLGRVYHAQGQPVLAEEQYRRAMDLLPLFRVPEEGITVSYALAELLLDRELSRRIEAESILYSIADAEGASDPVVINTEHQYIRLITTAGIDELVFLYRNELRISLKARRLLSEIAWESKEYRSALLHSTRTVLSLLSTASRRYREDREDWRFDIDPVEDLKNPDRDVRYPGMADGTADLLKRITDDGEMIEYLENQGLWPQLYLLGLSLYAEGFPDTAQSVWSLLVVKDSLTGLAVPLERAGRWGRLALRQLNDPFIPVEEISP